MLSRARHLIGPVTLLLLGLMGCTGRPVPPWYEVPDAERPGHAWRPMLSGTTGVLNHVWGSGSRNVLVAGQHGVMLRLEGRNRWRQMPMSDTDPNLSVGGSGADDIWGPGYGLQRYNGQAWHLLPESLQWRRNRFTAVWAPARNSAYFTQERGTILHFNGKGFSSVEASDQLLEEIWGSGPADIFAVGERGAVVHYDGKNWTSMPTPTQVYLVSVWGSGPDDVFAVGAEGVIIHYDGKSWTKQESGVKEILMAVWGTRRDEVYAAGHANAILRYDGVRWRSAATGWKESLGLPDTALISGLWGSGPSEIYAVGTPGLILHYSSEASQGDGGGP